MPSPKYRKRKLTIVASLIGREIAEKALIRLGFETKTNFAKSHLIGRSTVTRFFSYKPIQLDTFKRICQGLKLDWREIADISEGKTYSQPKKYNLSPSRGGEPVRRVTVRDKDSQEVKAVITLEGDINSDCNIQTLQSILEIHSGDTVEIIDVQSGSIKLIIEGSPEDIKKLTSKFESGELEELDGFPVEEVQVLSSDLENEEQDNDKWRLVRGIVEQPIKNRDLSGVDLSDADLSGVNLSGADLSDADLSNANLQYADLQYTNLQGTNLKGANLKGADIEGADLRGTELEGAYLPGADLRRLNNLALEAQKYPSGNIELNNLALEAQKYPPGCTQRRRLVSRLLMQLQKSGLLTRISPPYDHLSQDLLEEIKVIATQKLFIFIYEYIEKYDPQYTFWQWVTFLLKKRFFVQAFREVTGFNEGVKRLNLEEINKNYLPDKFTPLTSEEFIQYIEEDPEGIFQRTYLEKQPNANFRYIALRRFRGYSWSEIEKDLNISASTLTSFYQRHLQSFAPKLRDYLAL